jgi:signal transduction histidine kinase
MEASDLILIPGRHVAAPGEKEQDPNVNLSPEKIEALINADRASWVKMAHDLHDSVLPALKAIDAKDAMALSDAGAAIDKACEDCHLKYWYPKGAGKK